jgi:Peptide methionine sulfoxide reductase
MLRCIRFHQVPRLRVTDEHIHLGFEPAWVVQTGSGQADNAALGTFRAGNARAAFWAEAAQVVPAVQTGRGVMLQRALGELEMFQRHDTTTLNRQGADEGTCYRSIILYRDEEQKLEAEKSQLDAQKYVKNPIDTEIVPLKNFCKAEDHHQQYYDNISNQGFCQEVIAPKLHKLEQAKMIQELPQTKN